jgi:HNH endonuclease
MWENKYIVSETGCWLWTGSLDTNGYAQYKANNRTVRAHKYIYERLTKEKIPPGYQLHHECRNRNCVNPDHLEILTSGAHCKIHKKTHCKRGHEFTPENTLIKTDRNGCVRRACKKCRIIWGWV